jgi:hypothetical protein
MPFINTREEDKKPSTQKVTNISRKAGEKGHKFPDKPHCYDGKFEGVVGEKTKLTSF